MAVLSMIRMRKPKSLSVIAGAVCRLARKRDCINLDARFRMKVGRENRSFSVAIGASRNP
jgi:hypothetical protein